MNLWNPQKQLSPNNIRFHNQWGEGGEDEEEDKRGKSKRYRIDNVSSDDKLSLYPVNINNINSRKRSLESILLNNVYSLLTISETHCRANKKIQYYR